MTIPDLIADLKSRIDPAYSMQIGTESYERRLCVEALEAQAAEIERLHGIRATRGQDHSHECVRCGLPYTPEPGADDSFPFHSEDCPDCGCDGTVDAQCTT